MANNGDFLFFAADEIGMKTTTEVIDTPTPPPVSRVDWMDARGESHEHLPELGLLDRELYLATKQRTGHNYKGRRNYAGLHWFSNSGVHVWYESMLERRALIWLDFTYDIVAIASQPMLLHFPDGTSHYPDFIALHASGRQVLYNVKPEKFITDKVRIQFANATALGELAGWGHQVISTFEPTVIGNIEWLAQFRQSHFGPTEDIKQELLGQLHGSMSVGAAADLLTALTPTARIPALYNLAWYGHLTLDLTHPLSISTLIRKANS